MRSQLVLMALLILPAQLAMSEIYTWTDKDGNVTYGDSPPEHGGGKVTLAPIHKIQPVEPSGRQASSGADANSSKGLRRGNPASEKFERLAEEAEARKQNALPRENAIEAQAKGSPHSHGEASRDNSAATFLDPPLDLPCRTSACSSQIHKDFLASFIRDSKIPSSSFPDFVVNLTHSDNSKYLVVGHESGTIDIWDTTESRSKRQIKAHDYRANLISFTSDGKSFFSNSYFEDLTKLWNAKTGELLLTIPKTRGPVCATPEDDIYLITTSDSSAVRFFDLARKTFLPETFSISSVVYSMALHKESNQIAIGTASGTIEVWAFSRVAEKFNLQKIADAKPYTTGDWVVGLHFTQGGQRLYSVASSGVIDEWESATLKKQRSLPATIRVQSATFLKNTPLVALAGAVDRQGALLGFVETISLITGETNKYRANYNFPVIEFLPSRSSLMVAEYLSTRVYPIKSN